jgi:putative transposase
MHPLRGCPGTYSPYVPAVRLRLSDSLESSFCIEALELGSPEIFNTDQGVQFTNRQFTNRLEQAGVSISMDGRGPALDNVFVERLWWSVKCEHVYRYDHQTVASLHQGLDTYLEFFNRQRQHQSLEYATPWEVYRGKVTVAGPEPHILETRRGAPRVVAVAPLRFAALTCAARLPPHADLGARLAPVSLIEFIFRYRQRGPPQSASEHSIGHSRLRSQNSSPLTDDSDEATRP